jgi:hypothetical protein
MAAAAVAAKAGAEQVVNQTRKSSNTTDCE